MIGGPGHAPNDLLEDSASPVGFLYRTGWLGRNKGEYCGTANGGEYEVSVQADEDPLQLTPFRFQRLQNGLQISNFWLQFL